MYRLNGKETRPDDLPTEAQNVLDERNIKTITHLKSIEHTDKMVYLGGLLTADWRCAKESKAKNSVSKTCIPRHVKSARIKNTKMQTRKRILQCYI